MSSSSALLRAIVPRLSTKVVFGAPAGGLTAAATGASYRFATDGELDALLALSNEEPDEIAAMRARFRAGHRCVVGSLDGRDVFYGFVMLGEMELGTRIVPIAGDVAYAYKLFTAPAARGRRVAEGFYAFVDRTLAREHVRRLVACVAPDNAPSLRLHERCGFTRVGTLRGAFVAGTGVAVLDPNARSFVGEPARG